MALAEMIVWSVGGGLKFVEVEWGEPRSKGVIFDGFSGSGSFLLHAVGECGGSNGKSG
jgi:hypothetical protein